MNKPAPDDASTHETSPDSPTTGAGAFDTWEEYEENAESEEGNTAGGPAGGDTGNTVTFALGPSTFGSSGAVLGSLLVNLRRLVEDAAPTSSPTAPAQPRGSGHSDAAAPAAAAGVSAPDRCDPACAPPPAAASDPATPANSGLDQALAFIAAAKTAASHMPLAQHALEGYYIEISRHVVQLLRAGFPPPPHAPSRAYTGATRLN